MLRLGKHREAMQGTLNVIVANYDNKDIRAHFGRLAREIPDSGKMIMEILPLKNNDGASAYAYLAVVLKDQGAIEDSISLYEVYVFTLYCFA